MNVIIKPLENDLHLIEDVQDFLFNQIQKEFGWGYVPEWHQDIIKMDEYYINPEKNNFFVAFNAENNEIIATIGLRAYDKNFEKFTNRYTKGKTASIWRLFVLNKYRRCGLASKMVNVAENFANACEYSDIYLHTHKILNGALEFWSKMGFVVILDSCDELETVHMDKKINGFELDVVQSSFKYAVEF